MIYSLIRPIEEVKSLYRQEIGGFSFVFLGVLPKNHSKNKTQKFQFLS